MRFSSPKFWLLFISIAGLIAGCASSGVSLPESELLRVFERQVGRIAYLGIDGNLYVTDQTSSEHIQITDDATGISDELVYNFRFFSWAPNAERLLHTGYTPEVWTIQVSNPDSGESTRLFSDDATLPIHLQWTSTGGRVAFMTVSDPFRTEGEVIFNLRTADPDGGQPAALLAEGQQMFYALEPGGDRAIVHTGGSADLNPDAQLTVVTEGSDFERSLELPPAYFLTPAWSPDGIQLLMAIRDVQGQNALVTVNLQGQVRRTLTTFEETIVFGFSPDGRYVAFIKSPSLRLGASGVLTIVDASSGETVFNSEDTLVHAFSWSPTGERIAFFTHELLAGASEANPVSGFGLHFIDTGDWTVHPYRIGENLFAFQPTPQFRRYLQRFDQNTQGASIWSPDGENLLIPALTLVPGGEQGIILLVPAAGGIEPRELVQGLIAFWSPE